MSRLHTTLINFSQSLRQTSHGSQHSQSETTSLITQPMNVSSSMVLRKQMHRSMAQSSPSAFQFLASPSVFHRTHQSVSKKASRTTTSQLRKSASSQKHSKQQKVVTVSQQKQTTTSSSLAHSQTSTTALQSFQSLRISTSSSKSQSSE